MKKGDSLRDEHSVMRYVPWSKLRKDEDDNVLGFLGEGFRPKPKEENIGISVTWLEYFANDRVDQIKLAKQAIVDSYVDRGAKIGTKGAFGIGKVEKIRSTCRDNGYKVRVVYTPGKINKGHSTIRKLPMEDMKLLDALAAEAFAELVKI